MISSAYGVSVLENTVLFPSASVLGRVTSKYEWGLYVAITHAFLAFLFIITLYWLKSNALKHLYFVRLGFPNGLFTLPLQIGHGYIESNYNYERLQTNVSGIILLNYNIKNTIYYVVLLQHI